VLCGGIFSTVFGHRALDGWRGRDSHAPSLDGILSTPGSIGGTEERPAIPRGHWGFSWIFIDAIDFIDFMELMATALFVVQS